MKLAIGAKVNHPKYGEGIVFGGDLEYHKIFFQGEGEKEIAKEYEDFEIINAGPEIDNTISIEDIEGAMRTIFTEYADFTPIIPLGEKWKGGTLEFKPHDPGMQGKEIPIETFFKKIVMVRDRLRVLEQSINSSKNLSDEEKVNIQQYITRCYGSLTSFNILFARKEDHFIGDSKRREE